MNSSASGFWLREKGALALIGVFGILLLWFLSSAIPTDTPSTNWEMPVSVIMLGASFGLTYGLLAAGLVIVYRTSHVINFAHGEIGAFATAVFGLMAIKWEIPYWIAFVSSLIVGGAVAALAEVVVVRRLQNVPRLMSIVATLGVGQFLFVLGTAIFKEAGAAHLFPQPPGFPEFMVETLRVAPANSAMFALSPVLLVTLGLFLKRSRFGIGIRCSSANHDTARMVGIFSSRMSSLAWALGGVAAAFTAIVMQPTRGFTSAESCGPSLLLLALAAAVLARMSSITIAVFSGLVIGILEQLLTWNFRGGGVVELVLFVVILSALLVQRKRAVRKGDDKTSWASVQAIRPLPDELRSVWLIKHLGRIVTSTILCIALLLPFIVTSSASITLTAIIAFAIVALSISIVTGMGGQLTLGQFAFAGIGAVVSYHVSMRTGWFPLAFLYAGITAAIVAGLVGLPAIRIRGLMATVTTLAFALAAPIAMFAHPWLLGDGVDPGRPIVFGHAIETGTEYYFVGLSILVLVLIIVRNIRNSGFGRLLVAVRDNEDNSRAFTVSATRVKMQGFMCAGFIAGIGGAMYGHLLSNIAYTTFPVSASIEVAKISVIGGISATAGPLLGAIFVMAIPAFIPLTAAGLLATSLGQLVIIMYLPKGLIQVVVSIRDGIARYLAQRAGLGVKATFAHVDSNENAVAGYRFGQIALSRWPGASSRITYSPGGQSPGLGTKALLEVRGLDRSFGGVRAVNQVSFDVTDGETVGLIGPNGAGKTSTFDLISGFIRADYGTVRFDARDVTWLKPDALGRLGLIRSFQDAALFPTLTVEETVMLAGERSTPTNVLACLAGLTRRDVSKRRQARAVIDYMGLNRYREKQIVELSTGTKRIVELACLVSLQPRLLLLDEPSSGIAQRETEALSRLLVELKREFDLTLLIIEHDMPMIMGLADRIVAMADGKVVAIGTPDEIRKDERVTASYLGPSAAAIERSDARVATGR